MTVASGTFYRTCPLCEAMCGLQVEVANGGVASIHGDKQDPFSRGYMCPKGPALAALHEDPDRLREPLRRTKQGYETISWNEALDEAASRLHEIQRAHGRDALAVYVGNPAVHNLGTLLYGPTFLHTLKTRHRYSATSVDQLPQMMSAYFVYGHQLLLPVPDVDRTAHMIVWGGNPVVSNGSIMSAPDMKRRLKDLKARGGKLVVVDPRRSETAELANEHVHVRPGSDAALLAAMVHVLFEENLVERGPLLPHARHLDKLRAAVSEFAPEAVVSATGVAAARIRQLTREFAAAPRAVIYARVGVSMHPSGSLCHWLVHTLNFLTGNLDRPGGSMFTRPAFDIVGTTRPFGVGRGSFGRWKSQVRGLPEFGGELPVASLAEDIEAQGETPIRALLTIAGNPVLSTANGPRLEASLTKLDFRLAIDFYVNETTRHADLILPPSGPLEHAHFDVAFHALAIRHTVKYSEAVFEIGAHQRHDHEILAGLEQRLLALRRASRSARTAAKFREWMGPEGILELGLRVGPWGFGGGLRAGLKGPSLSKLRAHPHGIDLGALTPVLPGRLPKRRGGVGPHIDLAPELFVAELEKRRSELLAKPRGDRMLLIGRRQLRNNNSWMHNIPKLMTGKPRCTLLMHPEDAARVGIEEGQDVRVSSRVGSVVAPVRLDPGMMPGVVSLPHGFGHHRTGLQLRVAEQHAGVSINDITDDQRIDPLSGVAAFSGVPVQVTRAQAADEAFD